jgi:DNA-binding transcriptional ArsR family regulator
MNIQLMVNTLDLPAVKVVESLDALRAVADSQRHRILCLLINEPLTPTAIAEKLGIARTRVYYHLDVLRKHGFIAVVGERAVVAMIERTYRALARTFKVDRSMLAATAPESAIDDAQASLLERTADDLRNSPHRSSAATEQLAEVLVSRTFLRLAAEDARKLRAALEATLRQFAQRSDDGGDIYEMTVALFPTGGERP